MINWQLKTFDQLTKNELYDLLALRADVFAVEQNCPYQDLDYRDQPGQHLLGWQQDKLVAYCRILPPGHQYADAYSISRVVTSLDVRGQGLGKQLIEQTLITIKQQAPNSKIRISAQCYLQKFYESFGFIVHGEPYEEDNIPHIAMELG